MRLADDWMQFAASPYALETLSCVQSVLARGLHALLPPIEVIKGSYCNANPENSREWEVSYSDLHWLAISLSVA